MDRTQTPRLGAALVLLLLTSAARAELVGYTYSWGVSPQALLTGSNPATATGRSTGSVAFSLAGAGSDSSELGSAVPTRLPGASLTSSSSTAGNSPRAGADRRPRRRHSRRR